MCESYHESERHCSPVKHSFCLRIRRGRHSYHSFRILRNSRHENPTPDCRDRMHRRREGDTKKNFTLISAQHVFRKRITSRPVSYSHTSSSLTKASSQNPAFKHIEKRGVGCHFASSGRCLGRTQRAILPRTGRVPSPAIDDRASLVADARIRVCGLVCGWKRRK